MICYPASDISENEMSAVVADHSDVDPMLSTMTCHVPYPTICNDDQLVDNVFDEQLCGQESQDEV